MVLKARCANWTIVLGDFIREGRGMFFGMLRDRHNWTSHQRRKESNVRVTDIISGVRTLPLHMYNILYVIRRRQAFCLFSDFPAAFSALLIALRSTSSACPLLESFVAASMLLLLQQLKFLCALATDNLNHRHMLLQTAQTLQIRTSRMEGGPCRDRDWLLPLLKY